MKPREILGLDLGEVRTGVARGNATAGLAEPLAVIPTKDILRELDKLVAEKGVSEVVIGLPRNLEGQDTAQTTWVREWVAGAKAKIKPPIFWQDEALTSRSAGGDDAKAAALILQDFLDTPEKERVSA